MTDRPDIASEAVTFYKNIFRTTTSASSSVEEVKTTMFGIKSDTAPGRDGYTSQLFKKAWNIVGNEVIKANLCNNWGCVPNF